MRWRDKELGSQEMNPVTFKLYGDPGIASKYMDKGRFILGNLKLRMQLNNIKWGRQEVKENDGTIIQVLTNRNGLADIDEISIDVTALSKSKELKILGYIVQGFCEKNSSNSSASVEFSATTPSGIVFGYADVHNHSYGSKASFSDKDEAQGFPDYGAKYIDFVGNFPPRVNMYQEVFAFIYKTKTDFTFAHKHFEGENTYADPDPGAPSLGANYEYISSYFHEEGVCGPPPFGPGTEPAYSQTVNPCKITTQYRSFHINADRSGYTYDYVSVGTSYPQLPKYTGPWEDKMFLHMWCTKITQGWGEANYGKDLTFGDIPELEVFAKWAQLHLHNSAVTRPASVAAAPSSTASLMEVLPNLKMYDSTHVEYYTAAFTSYENFNITRQANGSGFMIDSGLSIGNGFTITPKYGGSGAGAIFMIKQEGSARNLRFSDIITSFMEDRPIIPPAIVDQNTDASGGSNVLLEDYPCENTSYGSGATDGYVEVSSHVENSVEDSSNFGIPCECEDGVHTVLVRKVSGADSLSLKVYILVEGAGFVVTDIPNLSGFSDNGTWLSQIKINIKNVDDIKKVPKLISVQPYTPVNG